MFRFSFSSLRSRIMLLILIAVLPALALILYSAAEQRRIAAEEAKTDALRLTRVISSSHEQLIESTEQLLRTLAQLLKVSALDPVQCNNLSRDLLKHHPYYANISATRTNGDVFCSAIPLKNPVTASGLAWFTRTIEDRSFTVGDFHIGRITGKPVLALSYPLRDNSEHVKGAVVAALNLDWLQHLIAQAQLPKGSTVAVMDSKGTILTCFPNTCKLAGKPGLQAPVVKTILAYRGEGTVEALGFDGRKRLYAFKPLMNNTTESAYVFVGVPSAIAFSKADQALRRNLLLFSSIALLTFTLAWFGSNFFILRRIRPLITTAQKISTGDLHARTGLSHEQGEMGAIARAFDEMAETLESREVAHRRSEEAIRESEIKYRTIFENTGSATIILEEDTTISLANAEFEKLSGFACAEIEGKKSWTEFFRGEELEKMKEYHQLRRLDSAAAPRNYVSHFLDRHGAYKSVFMTVAMIPGTQKSIALLLDIAERERTEQQITFLASIVQTIPDAVCSISLEGNIITWNKGAESMFGYTAQEVLGKSITMLLPENIAHTELHHCISILNTEGHLSGYETVRVTKDGRTVPVELTAVALKDEHQNITRYAAIMKDIAERKRAEEERANLEDQLRQSQKMEAVGLLAGGIAHDFNNILTAIIACGYILETKLKRDNSLISYVDQILASAERAANLTQSLLAFSRKRMINPRPVELNEILKRIEKLLSRIIGEDVDLKTLLVEHPLIVMADSSQVEQVLMNLATNARDAMPHGGILEIETSLATLEEDYLKDHPYAKPGTYALISVTDTGMGMDEKTQERMFEPFYTTKEVGKGTGLGLAMVYGIIKQHNGYINVYSEPGKGTTVKTYLPLVHASAAEVRQVSVFSTKGGTETILVAEDDTTVRELTCAVLKGAGYKVLQAVDGENALKVFSEHKEAVGLVLLDVIMPKKNGKEVFAELRKLDPLIKTVFMSGYTADIISKTGLAEEDLHFLLKPFASGELLQKVRKVLDG